MRISLLGSGSAAAKRSDEEYYYYLFQDPLHGNKGAALLGAWKKAVFEIIRPSVILPLRQ